MKSHLSNGANPTRLDWTDETTTGMLSGITRTQPIAPAQITHTLRLSGRQ